MEHITITTTNSGKFRANRTHHNVLVTCPNNSATVISDTARNMIRLVIQAIDLGWFRSDLNEIGVMCVHILAVIHEHCDHLIFVCVQ